MELILTELTPLQMALFLPLVMTLVLSASGTTHAAQEPSQDATEAILSMLSALNSATKECTCGLLEDTIRLSCSSRDAEHIQLKTSIEEA